MQEAGLDDEQSHELHERLEARGLELTDDCGHVDVADLRYANDDVAGVTTDALQMFLNELRHYPLLERARGGRARQAHRARRPRRPRSG